MSKNIEQIKTIIKNRVDNNLNSLLEEIQIETKETVEGVLSYNGGILPPRFRELKDELNTMILSYIEDTLVIDEEFVTDFV
jgi:hypothetical protein